MYANKFCDAGQVPIFRYFEACYLVSVAEEAGSNFESRFVGNPKDRFCRAEASIF